MTDPNPTGLTRAEAARLLAEHGPNRLAEAQAISPLRILARQFAGFLVLVLIAAIPAGEAILVGGQSVRFEISIGMGHKLARRAITAGEKVLKYGAPIGSATCAIATGDHVHLTNLKSDYTATYALDEAQAEQDNKGAPT